MCARCGRLSKSQNVLPVRDVASWNALISGLTRQGQGHEALNCFERMRGDGVLPNDITFTCILKACGITNAIAQGELIRAEIADTGLLERNIRVGNALVNMYAKCGLLVKARKVLEELPVRDTISWSSLISGYAQAGCMNEAIECFAEMLREGLCADEVTFASILKACGYTRAISKVNQIHTAIVNRGSLKRKENINLGNALLDMYAKCGQLVEAQQVFEDLPVRDIVSWSSLIAGYARHGCGRQALDCYKMMQQEGISPNDITFICVLKACGTIRDPENGEQIHRKIAARGLLKKNISLGNALIDMYAKCSMLTAANRVHKELPLRDVVSWNTLIAGYAHHGEGHRALDCAERMRRDCISPDEFTYACMLKACGSIGALEKGQKFHDEIVDRGLLKKNHILGNILVDMYAKCGALGKAWEVLRCLRVQTLVAWNALIAGYVQQERGHEALDCFARMQREGLFPDEVTFTCILTACASIGAINEGEELEKRIVNMGLLQSNISLGNALISMYSKCGMITRAHQVLEGLPVRNVVSWNTVIEGYAKHEQGHEALNCYVQMQGEGISPNEVTFVFILKACGSTGFIDTGKQIHDEIMSQCWPDKSVELATSLVDMYAKCGMLPKARELLKQLRIRDTISWSTLIAGYAQEGQGYEALACFMEMEKEGVSPDAVSFICVLNACARSGILDVGRMYYETMNIQYGIAPKLEHHTCMVVGFGCAGQLDKAMSVIKEMPSSDDPSPWLALLGACKKWGNVKLGELAFDRALQTDGNLPSAYTIMASIYAANGMQEHAKKIGSIRGCRFDL